MTPRLSLPGALAWDLGAMTGLSLDALAPFVTSGRPFTVAVDADRCERMWARRWSVVVATPITTPFGPAWSCTAQTQSPPPSFLCGGTAAAGPVGPDQPTTAPALTPRLLLHSSLIFSRALPFSDVPSLGPVRPGGALGIGVDDCFAEGLTWA